MAKCNLTAQAYIKGAFAPQVAILASEEAENICLRNNLRFVDLLQPFSKLLGEASIQDPSGNNVTIRDLRIDFEDMNRIPPQPTFGKRVLSDAVSNALWDQSTTMHIDNWGLSSGISLELHKTTPWFEVWREIFLHIQYPSDHEFTKHFVACIIVASSASENPLDQLNRLSQFQHQQQHQNPSRFPKWFSPNILKFYLLLHDVSQTEFTKAEKVFEEMESAYGAANCYLLKINSQVSTENDLPMPDPWKRILKEKGLLDNIGKSGSSETSSGTETPKDDLVGLPSRVSEGDSLESCELSQSHPLSPVVQLPDEKNGIDVPDIGSVPFLNKASLPVGNPHLRHGGCLTNTDHEEINRFVQEFYLKALIPHVERQIRYLNEVVTNRSRSKSLLSATRRWLGGNKPQSATTNSVVYGSEATELQTRRLGDLCFMFGLYEIAYTSYHTAKNDFKSDQAWLYFAGAQEMAALASFLHGASDFPKRYLDGSLHTYLNVCKVYNFAIRLTLLMTEILKHNSEYSEAAMCFIKMTSEESDLLSALMLEQAAHCFINCRNPLIRKYAFHMTLAAHRFSKAGQKSHSYRTYQQALQVYLDRFWLLAEDHIHYTMGKQAFQLNHRKESLEATTQLITPLRRQKASSKQSASQQAVYVKEYLNTLNQFLQLDENCGVLPILPIPDISSSSFKVLLGNRQPKIIEKEWVSASHLSFSDDESREVRWFSLESDLVNTVQGPPMIFRPNLLRMSNFTPNISIHSVPVKESIFFQFVVKNPLLVSLTLSDINLIYQFYDDSDQPINSDNAVECDRIPGFNLPPDSGDTVIIHFRPQILGRLKIIGVSYSLCLTVDKTKSSPSEKILSSEVKGKQLFDIKGPRLNSKLSERTSVTYAKDERLSIQVIPEMTLLSVRLKDPPAILCCGELYYSSVVFENISEIPLTKLFLALSNPRHAFFSFDEEDGTTPFIQGRRLTDEEQRPGHLKSYTMELKLPNSVLLPGQKLRGKLWVHAPVIPGAFDLELLFYYESKNYPIKNRYRLVRHLSSIYLEPCLSMKVSTLPSLCVHKLQDGISASHTHSFNMLFNLKNKSEMESSPSDISICGISSNSKHWAIVPHELQELSSVGVKQNIRFCTRYVCLRQKEESSDNLFLSYLPFVPSEKLLPSWWEFSLRSRIKLKDLMADPPPPNPGADYVPPPPTKAEIESKTIAEVDELNMIVTILWKGKRGNSDVYGQHNLTFKSIGDTCFIPSAREFEERHPIEEDLPPVRIIKSDSSVPNKSAQSIPSIPARTKLIKVTLDVPTEIRHNFALSPLCKIQYVLSLYNCCGCPLQVWFSLLSKSAKSSTSQQTQNSNPNILSVGSSTRTQTLTPWASCKVPLHSIITAPGTYSLGIFDLKIKSESLDACSTQDTSEYRSVVVALADEDQRSGILECHLSSELAAMHMSLRSPSISS